jgi:hypothetical protein
VAEQALLAVVVRQEVALQQAAVALLRAAESGAPGSEVAD